MNIDALLNQIAQKHPEQADIVRAFSPLARAQEKLRLEGGVSALKPWTLNTMPVNGIQAMQAVDLLSEALAEGFEANAKDFRAAAQALRKKPSPVRALCKAWLMGDKTKAQAFAAKHQLAPEPFAMLMLQIMRAMAAQAARRTKQALPEAQAEEAYSRAQCPCCGSMADMSVIFEKEGKRYLHCSLCGHVWRFSRLACPYCSTEKVNNLRWIFAEGHPEERAVACAECQRYALEVDARPLQIDSPNLAYYATLGMGHLDALAQEEGLMPGTWPGPKADSATSN